MPTSPGNPGLSQLAHNALSNWMVVLLQFACAFFLSPLLACHLGRTTYGIWAIIESILAYLMLLDCGLAAAVLRYVPRYHASSDLSSLNRLINTSLLLFAMLGAGVLLVTFLLLHFCCFTCFNVPPDLQEEAIASLWLLAGNLALSLPFHVFSSVLDGLNQFFFKNTVRIAILLLKAIWFYLLLFSSSTLIDFAIATTVTNLLEKGIFAAAAFAFVPGLRFNPFLFSWPTFKTIRGYSCHALLALLAGRIAFQSDALVLAVCIGPTAVTSFFFAGKLTEYFKILVRSGTSVLTPAISALDAWHDVKAIRSVYVNCSRLVFWAVLPFPVFLSFFGESFLRLWLGNDLTPSVLGPLIILGLPLALTLSQSVAGRILYGMGYLRWFSLAVVLEAIINLGLSFALAPVLGINGVALGTTLPHIVFNLWLIHHTCQFLDIPVLFYFRQVFFLPLLVSIILILSWFGWSAVIFPHSWWQLVLLTLAGVIPYALVALWLESGTLVRSTLGESSQGPGLYCTTSKREGW